MATLEGVKLNFFLKRKKSEKYLILYYHPNSEYLFCYDFILSVQVLNKCNDIYRYLIQSLKHFRSYYRCLHINSTGCCATKILQPNDTDPNMLSAMYIYEHNHKFPNEPHLQLSAEPATTRKRKEPDVPGDEHTSKRQLNSQGDR